mmetsp:Transcript_40536/g.49164  ORF Transcript_40536/g.49164 Transcript_40536/m.49164 type:complete len:162 (+) Transcript_40536:161-646(+)|eukprot:CAMPEP_0197867598 /NCGR_PEP_ID=MMETSP1438-20131217/44842_1 /TAXON_ID=1461541 /ORGANISM="Pterosperma sp., Strain CCMP1384" /LENGTH=161 /DNA_ID=CAMNT_0043486259 /DNA_START=144 /DNA_END=629 /DNA_ORIENTATION=-
MATMRATLLQTAGAAAVASGIALLSIYHYLRKAPTPVTVHKGVHVLLVELSFESQQQRDKWAAAWSALATRVYCNEPNCLSYELCVHCDDPTKVIIYERYVSREDLDGPHQVSIRDHKALPSSDSGVSPTSVKFTNFTESNIGYMIKGSKHFKVITEGFNV